MFLLCLDEKGKVICVISNCILPYNTQVMDLLGTLKNVSFGEKYSILCCFALSCSFQEYDPNVK
jgi:hypothetical protein